MVASNNKGFRYPGFLGNSSNSSNSSAGKPISPAITGDAAGVHDMQQEQNPDVSQTDEENNSGVNDEFDADLWEPEDAADDTSAEQDADSGFNDPQEAINTYLRQLDLSFEPDERTLEALSSPEGVANYLQDTQEKVGKAILKVMSDMSKVMDAKIKQAIDESVSRSSEVQTVQRFRETLRQEMPDIASDKALMPVVESVARRLYARNMSHDEVMRGVRAFINRMASKAGIGTSDEGRAKFGGRYAKPSSDNIDWLKHLQE